MARKPDASPKKTGRPSLYSPELLEVILSRIANGESLLRICAPDDMPAESTVRGWLATIEDADLSAKYARARALQADHYAERVEFEAMTATDASLGRLKMDALKWTASKLAPKKYVDKVQHVGGEPEDAPIQHSLAVTFVEPSREQD